MRVVELSTFNERCGIATYTEALSDALRELGVDVAVLSPRLPEGGAPRGPSPERLWSRHKATVGEAVAAMRAVERHGADIAHLQVHPGLFSARFLATFAALARAKGLPVVATLHGRRGGDVRHALRDARVQVALLPARIVVHNEQHRAEVPRPGVSVIAHGMRPPAPPVDVREAKRATGVDPDRPVLAHFGFLTPHKGVEAMLDAVAELTRGPFPRLLYRVVGSAPSGSEPGAYLERLRARARRLGIEDNVELAGDFVAEDQATLRLQSADWIVLAYESSANEGTSGAARFALSAGRPLAVSASALFDDLRPAARTIRGPLAAELARLLASPELGAEAVRRARSFAESSTWPRVAERHLALFRELHGRRGRTA